MHQIVNVDDEINIETNNTTSILDTTYLFSAWSSNKCVELKWMENYKA